MNTVFRAYPPLLLVLIVLGFVLGSFRQVTLNTESDALDQGAYLSIGLSAREGQSLTDPVRQPFYSWLLAPLAHRDLSYFTWAKLFGLAVAALCVIVCYLVAWRLYHNSAVASLAAFLLASNVFFIEESATIMVEPLLALMLLLVWTTGLRAFAKGYRLDWAVGGLLTGVAYLAKESGLLWLAAWGAGAVVVNRLRAKAYGKLLLFVGCAVLAASPLFIYNSARYGAPLRNDNLNNVIWMDDWEQFFAIGPAAQVSMSSYFQTHTLSEVGNRLFWGMLRMGRLTLAVFMPFQLDRKLWDGSGIPLWLPLGAVVLAVALIYLYRHALITYVRENTRLVVFTVTYLIVYLLGAAWLVPITIDPRYVVPLLPMGYILTGGTVLYLGQYSLKQWPDVAHRLGRGMTIVLGVAILVWTGSAALHFQWADPFEADKRANVAESAVVEKLGQVATPSTVVYQPSHGLPIWLIEGPTKIVAVPSNVDWTQFVTYLHEQKAEFLVMTSELYERRESLFKQFLYPAWPGARRLPSQRERLLDIRVLPASWDLLMASQGLPGPYYIFRLRHLPDGKGRSHIERGDAWLALGDWERAEEEYTAALSAAGSSRTSIERVLGQIAVILGQYQDALRHFDAAIALEPDSAWCYVLRGDLHSALGDSSSAVENYQAALERGGQDWANVHASLAWVQAERGSLPEAIQGYRQAVSLSPQNPWYSVRLGQALAAYGLPAEAVPPYQDVVDRKTGWPFLHSWLADAYQAIGKPEAAARERADLGEPPQIQTIPFVNGPILKGYRIDSRGYIAKGILKVTLYWTPSTHADQDYRAYAKLVNAVYGVWGEGQSDLSRQGVPGGLWAADVELQDTLTVRVLPGTPPGAYPLSLDIQSTTRDRWLDTVDKAQVKLGPVELVSRPWLPDEMDITERRAAQVGGKVKLLGYRVDGDIQPGQTPVLTLFWQAIDRMDTRYTVFTHLTDKAGKIWAQKDNEPADGFYPTTLWQAGEIVRDHYPLPIPGEAPPGEYTLQVGMYVAETGERLAVTGEAAAPSGDHIVLKTVSIKQ